MPSTPPMTGRPGWKCERRGYTHRKDEFPRPCTPLAIAPNWLRCPSARLPVCPSTRLPVYPFTRLPVYPFTPLPPYPLTQIDAVPRYQSRFNGRLSRRTLGPHPALHDTPPRAPG